MSQSSRPAYTAQAALRDALARVIVVCQRLADGDTPGAYAVASDLEEDLTAAVQRTEQRHRKKRCPRCGALRWPGQLGDHLRNVHGRRA